MSTSDDIFPAVPTALEGKTLVGMREIADRLAVPRTTASMWHSRRATTGFPEAVASLSMGPVFDWSAVQSWYDAWINRGSDEEVAR